MPERRCIFLFAFILMTGTGCGSKPPMVVVSGTVTLNGKAIEHCQVCFYPEDLEAAPEEQGYGLAWTDSEGKFAIMNPRGDAGIFPGKYRVVLIYYCNKDGKALPKTAKPSETPGGFFNNMPKEYEDPGTTPEIVEVTKDGLQKDFNIVK